MGDAPDSTGAGANIFALGQAALDSGTVDQNEVNALLPLAKTPQGMQALHQALGKPTGDALIPPSLRAANAAQSPVLPDATGLKTGKGKQSKQTSKTDESQKLNQTRNVWSTPDEINSRIDAISNTQPILEQKKGIADAEKLLSMQEQNANKDGWIKPLLALADSQNGGGVHPGNMAASFTAPEVAQTKVMKAQDDLQKRKESLNKLIFDAAGKAKEGTDNSQLANSIQQMLGYTQGMVNGQNRMDPDDQIHQRNITALKKDPLLRKNLGNMQTIENALNNATGVDKLTNEQFHELQQAIRSSITKGTGGVDERAATYYKSLGMSERQLMQYIESKPESLSINDPFVQHVLQIGNAELGNLKRQSSDQANFLTKGNKSMYSRRPDLQSDLDDLTGGVGQVFSPQLSDRAKGKKPKVSGSQTASNGKYPSGAPDATWTPAQVDAFLADHGG